MRGWTSRVTAERKAKPRLVTAAALKAGLADNEFWDGEGSVRLVTWLHLAVVVGFLAVVLGVTAKALTGTGSPHVIALWWIAVGSAGPAHRPRPGGHRVPRSGGVLLRLRATGRVPQKHSGCWADPRVWSLINRVAAGLPSANGSASGSQASVPPPELIRELAPAPEVRPA